MADTNRNLTEELFEAIQTITDKSLEGLSYDKTILCSITDASRADLGEYKVTDGSIEFTAYSDNTKYSKNTNVYVTIPQGDYNNKRIIIGKYQKEEDKPYIYVPPMENYVNITNNLINNNNIDHNQKGLLANGSIQFQMLQSLTNISYVGYDRLGIKANFTSLLDTFNVTSGSYGLALKILCQEKHLTEYDHILQDSNGDNIWTDENANNIADEEEQLIISDSGNQIVTYWLYFDSADMFGNPYNFISANSQEKVFDISSFAEINSIDLYFYQKSDFKDSTNTLIPHSSTSLIDNISITEDFANNLFVDDIEITLGYDLSQFDNNTILLYTLDSKTYSATADNNSKKLQMRWITKTDNDRLVAFDNETDLNEYDPNSYKIHWYRWKLDAEIFDELAGAFWQEYTKEPTKLFEKNFSPEVNLQYERIKVGIENFYINPEDGSMASEYFESNILELENERQVPNPATIDLIRGLTLYTDDEYNGVYCLYGPDSKIMNERESNIDRHLIASYHSLVTGINGLDGDETIKWEVPAHNSMIQIDTTDSNWVLDSKKEYYVRQSIIDNDATMSVESLSPGEAPEKQAYITYRINKQYSQLDNNNTIRCTVTKNNLDYISEIIMSFGTAGTNGTDYTLVLEIADPDGKNALPRFGTDRTLTVRSQLRDYDNKVLESDIKFGWWEPQNKNIQGRNDIFTLTSKKNGEFYECVISINNNQTAQTPLILKATTNYGNIKNLTAYLPIPLAYNSTISKYTYEGPTTIIYDATGQNPVFTRKPCNLYNQSQIQLNGDQYTWNCWHFSPTSTAVALSSTDTSGYYPLIKPNDYNIITPPSILFNNLEDIPCIVCTENTDQIRRLWIQPVLMIMNRFGSSMLNQWDGSLKVDEENNQILSSLITAGKKEENNTFTGVNIGEIGKVDSTRTVGLSAYGSGIQTFLLDANNGNVTIGAASAGQIKITPSAGTIQSNNYSTTTGMKINLKDGKIDAYNFKLESDKVVIDSSNSDTDTFLKIRTAKSNGKTLMAVGTNNYYLQSADSAIKFDLGNSKLTATGTGFSFNANGKILYGTTAIGSKYYPYFQIKNNDGKYLLDISNTANYYLQSSNYADDNQTGMKIDLTNGKIDAYNFKLESDKVVIDSTPNSNNYFQVRTAKSNGQTLMKVGTTDYYLQSADGAIKFDLGKSKFTATGTGFVFNANNQIQFGSELKNNIYYPYFTITTKDKNNKDKNLFNISYQNKEYYLQSANYSTTDGMKIDLTNGKIDAYNFKLTSKNIIVDSTENSNNFLQVKDNNGNILINAGANNYYLQSATKNIKFDLKNNTLVATGTGFVFNANGQIKYGTEIKNGTSYPYFTIMNYAKNQTLFTVGTGTNHDEYYLQSNKFNSTTRTGTRIDLSNDKITSYNFNLNSNKVVINSAGTNNGTNPIFQIRTTATGGVNLMVVGSSSYYLQSLDQSIKFNLGTNSLTVSGTANFSFNANDLIKFGTGINTTANAKYSYFIVGNPNYSATDNTVNKNFIYCNNNPSNRGFYLQSGNFNSTTRTGTRINFSNDKITSYNFNLDSNKVVIDSAGYNNDTRPIFQIRTGIATTDVQLMVVGSSKYYLQSKDFNTTAETGFKLDLGQNKITGYNTLLKFISTTGTVTLNSAAETYPFSVTNKSNANYYFKVNWNGSIQSTAGKIGNWNINTNRLESTGGSTGLAPNTDKDQPVFWSGYTAYDTEKNKWKTDWKSKVSFGVSGDGILYANKGFIGNWSINDDKALTGVGTGNFITLDPESITLGSYQSYQENDDGELILSGKTETAKITATPDSNNYNFFGNLDGKARYASWADGAYLASRATADADGNKISEKYSKVGHSHSFTQKYYTSISGYITGSSYTPINGKSITIKITSYSTT